MKKMLAFLLAFVMLFSLACVPALAENPQEQTPPEDGAVAEEVGETPAEEPAEEPTEEPAEEPAEEAAAEEAKEEEAAEEAKEEEVAEEVEEDIFADWNPEAPALSALVEYVEAVTDEASPDFIPVKDRIAVFDMDGTLCAELCPTYLEYYLLAWRILKDPSYTPDGEMLEFGRMLRDHSLDKVFPDHMDLLHATHAAKAYAGMTLQEFASFVNGCLLRDCDGFEGMTWATAFYAPMINVVDYLNENDFKVYICSGTDRFICRTFVEGMLDIPSENIIGMDVGYEATGQGDTDGLDYVFKASDEVVRTDRLIIKNLKMNKVQQIIQDIGKQPVLSFGNSSGDVSMHMYTITNNPYRSAAFMLIANDDVRDYGNVEKAEKLGKQWEEYGFHVISMRDDFRTIYGDEVVKTGEFHWLEDLAEDRTPVEVSPEWVSGLEAAKEASQVLVVAAVDKTTAYISLHEKDSKGEWKQLMTTPGFIGELGKEEEGDGKTPVGTFRFNAAFGIAADPGCAIEYTQVDGNSYWSGDVREGYHYNQMVSTRDYPDLDTASSERIKDFPVAYQYCLNVNYNEDGVPGLGSAIFLHCFGPSKPYTNGGIEIPKDQMLIVMQNVSPDCVVVIDSLEKLSPETWADWGFAPTEVEEPVNEPVNELYTEEDLAAAEAKIHEEFDKWGCELHSLNYAGDASCTEENLAWMNSLGNGEPFTQCAEFVSDFTSPKDAVGSWEPDTEYTGWQWWLARTEGGDWQLLTWGY